ncbi:MAG: hypothetical protein ACREQ4_01195 [Candidatus Binataceae bacterium]
MEEHDGLRQITRLRAWTWFWLLSWPPLLLMVGLIFGGALPIAVFLAVWTIGLMVSVWRAGAARCPRCKSHLRATSRWNPFERKCGKCGMSLRLERVIYPSLE